MATGKTNAGVPTPAKLTKYDNSESGLAATNVQDAIDEVKSDIPTKYAGSASAGGSATSAVKLDSSAGSATQPVFFSNGKPVATTFELCKTVPADAKLTDTTYEKATSSILGLVKIGFPESGKNYPVELNDDGQMFVNVPWTDNNTVYSHPTTSGNRHIPSGGSSGQILRWSADGTAAWGNDKDTTYSKATSDTLGLVKIGFTESGKNYPVELNDAGQMFVNVPWTDNDTTYTALKNPNAMTVKGNGTTSFTYDGSAAKTLNIKAGSNVSVSSDTSGNITISSTDTNTTYNQATSSALGLVKIGFPESGKNYPVELNDDGQMFVNVPWTDNNSTYSNMTGASSSAAGKAGLVPAPAAGKQASFLRGDGTWAVPTNTTYSAATTSTAGLMSAADKTKLDTITENADAVSFSRSLTSGTKIGTITINGTAIDLYCEKNTNTTYNQATSSALGLVKIGYTESGQNYPVELNDAGQMFVNVPWTDTNTTYTALKNPNALTVKGNGTTSFTYDGSAAKSLNIKPGSNVSVSSDTSGNITISATNTTYSAATTSAAGLMTADMVTKLNGIAAGANAYTHPTTTGNKHIPSGGSSGQILRWSADGTAAWGADNNTTYTFATGDSNGQIKVTPSGGSAQNISVKGLGSAAYTAATAYAAASHTHDCLYYGDSKVFTTALSNDGNGYIFRPTYKTGTSETIIGVLGSEENPWHISHITNGYFNYLKCNGIFETSVNSSGVGILKPISDGNTALGTTSLRFSVVNSNVLRSYSTDTTTSGVVARIASDRIYRANSSSERYKEDIEPITAAEIAPEKLYDAEVVQFRYKDDYLIEEDPRRDKLIPGFIVEKLEEVYPIAVDYNDNGEPEMWNDTIMVPAILKLVQNHKKTIDSQQETINNQQAEIDTLKKEMNELKETLNSLKELVSA